jgi:hypothetical protein
MKTVSAAILCIATCPLNISFAQTIASSYSGLTAALNLNLTTIGVKASDPIGNSIGNVSASDQNVVVQIAKGLPFGSNGVANFGVSANLGDMKSGSFGPLQLKATCSTALYAEIGYAFDTKSMAYGKLSINQLTAALSGAGPGVDGNLSANGFGFGAGYRHSLSLGTYLQGELMQVNYSEVVSAAGLILKPASTTAMVGLGFRF